MQFLYVAWKCYLKDSRVGEFHKHCQNWAFPNCGTVIPDGTHMYNLMTWKVKFDGSAQLAKKVMRIHLLSLLKLHSCNSRIHSESSSVKLLAITYFLYQCAITTSSVRGPEEECQSNYLNEASLVLIWYWLPSCFPHPLGTVTLVIFFWTFNNLHSKIEMWTASSYWYEIIAWKFSLSAKLFK